MIFPPNLPFHIFILRKINLVNKKIFGGPSGGFTKKREVVIIVGLLVCNAKCSVYYVAPQEHDKQ